MYRQRRSMCQEEEEDEDQDPVSTGPIEPNYFTEHATYYQIFPAGFSMGPAVFQQPHNLTTSFGNYTQTSPVDTTQPWATPQQSYADVPSTSPVHQGLPTLIPRLSMTRSLVGDEGDDTSGPPSPPGEGTERKKERRRAQNRAAQKAFRARKEETIKESLARLGILQEELVRLESANCNLSETVGRLRSEVARLREENAALRGRRANRIMPCEYAQYDEVGPRGMVGCAKAVSNEHKGKLMDLGVDGGILGTVPWPDRGGLEGETDEDEIVAEAVVDAAAALSRNIH